MLQLSRLTTGRAVSFEVPDAARGRPHTSPTAKALGGMGGLPRRLAKNLTLMSLYAAYYILQNRYRRFADAELIFSILGCCHFQCLMRISAELYMIHVTSSNGKYM